MILKCNVLFTIMLFFLFFSADIFSDDDIDNKSTHLEALVSPDENIRKNALLYLDLEFSQGNKPRYQNYGDDLFPYLIRALNNVDDKYTHHAVEAIYHLSFFQHMTSGNSILGMNEKVKKLANQYNHYPNPLKYTSIKKALIRILNESSDVKSQEYAAKALANGFTPVAEIEAVLFSQLLKVKNKRNNYAILQGIQTIAQRKDYVGDLTIPAFGLNLNYKKYENGLPTGGGSIKRTLLENQALIVDASNLSINITINKIDGREFYVEYKTYRNANDKSELSNDLSTTTIKGNFGEELTINLKDVALQIDMSMVVTDVANCPKKHISACHLIK